MLGPAANVIDLAEVSKVRQRTAMMSVESAMFTLKRVEKRKDSLTFEMQLLYRAKWSANMW